MTNKKYTSSWIVDWLDGYRETLDDFYPSERWAFKKLPEIIGAGTNIGKVLDAGCGTGGLYRALSNNLQIDGYMGVDINPQVIDRAQVLAASSERCQFLCSDILELDIPPASFDTVISLSCVDWNIETKKMMDHLWALVKDGGCFLLSVRLTSEASTNDISKSYQDIGDLSIPDRANYVVFNFEEFLRLASTQSPQPSNIYGYGYWGKPGVGVHTHYDSLVMAVFILEKRKGETSEDISLWPSTELNLPADLFF